MEHSITNSELTPTQQYLIQAFAKLHKTALGVAVGLLGGLIVFSATMFLYIKGGKFIGPNLSLLGQFFVGYSVTPLGGMVGFFYGFITGFVAGWLFAFVFNVSLSIYLFLIKLKENISALTNFIDSDHV